MSKNKKVEDLEVDFIHPFDWNRAGIEQKVEMLYYKVKDILEYLEKKGKGVD